MSDAGDRIGRTGRMLTGPAPHAIVEAAPPAGAREARCQSMLCYFYVNSNSPSYLAVRSPWR
jgi:hypothetical protein